MRLNACACELYSTDSQPVNFTRVFKAVRFDAYVCFDFVVVVTVVDTLMTCGCVGWLVFTINIQL